MHADCPRISESRGGEKKEGRIEGGRYRKKEGEQRGERGWELRKRTVCFWKGGLCGCVCVRMGGRCSKLCVSFFFRACHMVFISPVHRHSLVLCHLPAYALTHSYASNCGTWKKSFLISNNPNETT